MSTGTKCMSISSPARRRHRTAPGQPADSAPQLRASTTVLEIPIGVAHGFLALSDIDLIYLVSEEYAGTDEFGIAWNDPSLAMRPYPCEEATELALPKGKVPHFLPGKSPLPGLNPKITDRFGTPFEARQGGPETMYPEYQAKVRQLAASGRSSGK